jgi:hypothetical protein
MANAKLISAGCEAISPIKVLCKAVNFAVGFVVKALVKILGLAPAIDLEVNKAGLKVFLRIPIGDGLNSFFPFARWLKGIELQIGTEVDFSSPKNSIPGFFFRICRRDGTPIWMFKSEWISKLLPTFAFGIINLQFSLKTLPEIIASFSGTLQFNIMQIFNWKKHDEWVLKLGGYFKQPATGAPTVGLSFETLKSVYNAFGIPKFNLHKIKIVLELTFTTPWLKSLELALAADFGPITGVAVGGKLDIQMPTNCYFFFMIDKVVLSKVVGAVIGKKLSGWPAFLDFKLDKTSMYFSLSLGTVIEVDLGDMGKLSLKPGFAIKTGIRMLGMQIVIDLGFQLNGLLPYLYINQFKIDIRKLLSGIQAIFDAIGKTVSRALNWKPLRTAISMIGKALVSMFPLVYINIEGLEVDCARPQNIKLPSIELGFNLVGKMTGIKIPGFGIQEGIKAFPKLFKAALRAFANCWKWIKILVGKLWQNLKALVMFAVKAIGKFVGAAIKFIGQGIKNLCKAIGNAAVAVGKAFKAAAKAVGKAVKAVGKAIAKAGKAVTKFLKGAGKAFGKAAKFIGDAFKNPGKALKAVGAFFMKIVNWNGMVNGIKNVVGAIGKIGKKILGAIGKTAKKVWRGTKRVARKAWRGTKRFARRVTRFLGRRRRLLNTADGTVTASSHNLPTAVSFSRRLLSAADSGSLSKTNTQWGRRFSRRIHRAVRKAARKVHRPSGCKKVCKKVWRHKNQRYKKCVRKNRRQRYRHCWRHRYRISWGRKRWRTNCNWRWKTVRYRHCPWATRRIRYQANHCTKKCGPSKRRPVRRRPVRRRPVRRIFGRIARHIRRITRRITRRVRRRPVRHVRRPVRHVRRRRPVPAGRSAQNGCPCGKIQADFKKAANKNKENGYELLDAAKKACDGLEGRWVTAQQACNKICSSFRNKCFQVARDLKSSRDVNKFINSHAKKACRKQEEKNAVDYCKKHYKGLSRKCQPKFLNDCKRQKTVAGARSRYNYWKKRRC